MDLKRLKELRTERGISIKKMCEYTKLHRETIYRIDRGSDKVTVASLNAYVQALGDMEIRLIKR